MKEDERRQRVIRRDEDLRRLRQLTIAAGVLGVGLFGAASIVAASNQPGRDVGATNTSGSALQSESLSSQSAFQPPAMAPFGRHRSWAFAVSGGS